MLMLSYLDLFTIWYAVSLVPDWPGKWTYPTTQFMVFVAHTHRRVGVRSA
jgi:hypothetical protein